MGVVRGKKQVSGTAPCEPAHPPEVIDQHGSTIRIHPYFRLHIRAESSHIVAEGLLWQKNERTSVTALLHPIPNRECNAEQDIGTFREKGVYSLSLQGRGYMLIESPGEEGLHLAQSVTVNSP